MIKIGLADDLQLNLINNNKNKTHMNILYGDKIGFYFFTNKKNAKDKKHINFFINKNDKLYSYFNKWFNKLDSRTNFQFYLDKKDNKIKPQTNYHKFISEDKPENLADIMIITKEDTGINFNVKLNQQADRFLENSSSFIIEGIGGGSKYITNILTKATIKLLKEIKLDYENTINNDTIEL